LLYAFDLLELDGADLRREPLEVRKATLASLLHRGAPGVRLCEHLVHPGDIVFRHACKMGSRASCRSALARATRRVARTTG
jgi:bifunctional non-homologous end joining protein LigD